jgi:hypothetical protein
MSRCACPYPGMVALLVILLAPAAGFAQHGKVEG